MSLALRWCLLVGCLLSAAPVLAAETVVATYTGGVITATEWSHWQEAHRAAKSPQSEQDLLNALVFLKSSEALPQPPLDRNRREALGRLALGLAAYRFAETARSEAEPDQKELQAAIDAYDGRWDQDRRWALHNIFLPWSKDAQSRESTRAKALALRQRVLDGESFADLAREHSHSQTRRRGGRMGLVSLRQLRPEIAVHVDKLKPGAVSDIIATDDGVTLLYCRKTFAQKTVEGDELRQRVRRRLRRERLMAQLMGVLGDSPPEDPLSLLLSAAPATDDLRWRNDAFVVAMRRQALAAEQRGWLDAGYHRVLRWQQRQLHAEWAFEAEQQALIPRPDLSEARLRSYYRRYRPRWLKPERWAVRGLKVSIDVSQSRTYFRELDVLATTYRAGRLRFADVAERLGPAATRMEWGWLTKSALFSLGANLEAAVHEAALGTLPGWVQEGNALYLVEVYGHASSHQRSFAAVKGAIAGAIETGHRRKHLAAARAARLAALSPRFVESWRSAALDSVGARTRHSL